MPRRHINPPLNLYRKIAFSFIILTIVVIGVIFYFTLSYAYITISPKAEEIQTDFNFIIVNDQSAAKPEEGIFAGKIVDQTIEAEKSFPATGTKILAGDIVGRVKIFNNQSRGQILIATTRLLTADNILFRIKERVDIPANGSVEADVYPDDAAKPLALAGAKLTVPGLSQSLQQVVYAQAIEDFKTAGQEVKAVSQSDLDEAVKSYGEELAQQAVQSEDSAKAKILSKEYLAKEFSNVAGDQVTEFKLKLKVHVIGVVFDKAAVEEFAQKVISEIAPEGKQLVTDSSDKLIYEITQVDLPNKLVQVKSVIKGLVVINEDNQILDRGKLIRMNPSELKSYLENFDDIEKVEISFFPGFLKKMPFFQDHIIIKISQ